MNDKLHLLLLLSEVVNSLKDFIDHSRETGTGPMGKLMVYMVDSSYASIVINGSIK
jgi:cytochrome b